MDLLRDSVGRLYLKFLLPSLFSALVTTIYSFCLLYTSPSFTW